MIMICVNTLKKEDIVSGMTRPEAVPAMGEAAAIVTAEGGMTSHAAVAGNSAYPVLLGRWSQSFLRMRSMYPSTRTTEW